MIYIQGGFSTSVFFTGGYHDCILLPGKRRSLSRCVGFNSIAGTVLHEGQMDGWLAVWNIWIIFPFHTWDVILLNWRTPSRVIAPPTNQMQKCQPFQAISGPAMAHGSTPPTPTSRFPGYMGWNGKVIQKKPKPQMNASECKWMQMIQQKNWLGA